MVGARNRWLLPNDRNDSRTYGEQEKLKVCYNRPMKFITYRPEGLKGSTAFSKNPSGRFV
jgi:hypothetical protein